MSSYLDVVGSHQLSVSSYVERYFKIFYLILIGKISYRVTRYAVVSEGHGDSRACTLETSLPLQDFPILQNGI